MNTTVHIKSQKFIYVNEHTSFLEFINSRTKQYEHTVQLNLCVSYTVGGE